VCAPYEKDPDLVDTELFDQLGDQVEGCAKSVIATGEQRIYANLLAVDAHALQHPKDHGVKNNPFHLIRLCWLLEHGGDPRLGQGPRWLQVQFDGNPEIPVLEPPTDRGKVTVVDVYGAASADEHAERVYRWAQSVWEAWSAHHAWARRWTSERGGRDRADVTCGD